MGEVSLLKVLLDRPIGDRSLSDFLDSDLLDNLDSDGDMEDDSDENSSVGENDGRNALGSRGVEVKDLHEVQVGDGRVLLLDLVVSRNVGERGGNGGRFSDKSDLDTGRWRFISDLEIVRGTSKNMDELGREQSQELLNAVLDWGLE